MTERPPGWPDWADALDLQPHPEGGWFAETYRSDTTLTPDGYPGARATATGILFLLLPGEQSRWHRVRSDELWIHQHGGPLDLVLGGADADPGPPRTLRLGRPGEPDARPQGLVPAGVWQAASPAGDEPVLVACVVSPGFDFADFELRAEHPTPADTR